MITLTPLMITSHLVQPHLGLLPSLALGWAVYLSLFIPITRWQWNRQPPGAGKDEGTTVNKCLFRKRA